MKNQYWYWYWQYQYIDLYPWTGLLLSDEAPVYFRDAGWPFFQGAIMQCTPINIQMRTPAQIIEFNNKIADAAGCDTLEGWFELN